MNEKEKPLREMSDKDLKKTLNETMQKKFDDYRNAAPKIGEKPKKKPPIGDF